MEKVFPSFFVSIIIHSALKEMGSFGKVIYIYILDPPLNTDVLYLFGKCKHLKKMKSTKQRNYDRNNILINFGSLYILST